MPCLPAGVFSAWLFFVAGAADASVPYPSDTGDCGQLAQLPCGTLIPAYKLVEQPDISHLRGPRDLPDDPLFTQQWHLRNTGAGGGTPGIDLNLEPWWNFAENRRLGAGVVIGIIDSGVEYTHADLAASYRPELSYDYLVGDADPFPSGGTFHGTAVAGLAVGRGNNGLGIAGVAPRAGLAAIRLTSPTFQTDAMEAASLTHQNNNQGGLGTVHVYCNPWGPSDSRPTLAGPGPLTRAALENAVTQGRGGLGSIITWACGNGHGTLDNTNYDGYANSRFVIAVGSCTNQGLATSYSEPGACLFVVAPADGGPGANSQVTSTDRTGTTGRNIAASPDGDYFSSFGGTSSAVPQIAGIAALLLEENPALSWRDVKHILAQTARQISPADPGWATNAAGFLHHHHFGFGLADAAAAGTLASSWSGVAVEVAAHSPPIPVNLPIPDGSGTALLTPVFGAPASSSYVSTASLVVETVSVSLNMTHPYRGDIEVVLTSPSGMESVLAGIRNDSGDHYNDWTFTSVRHWGEYAAGTWTLQLRDGITNDAGTFVDWSLAIHGTAADPMPQSSEFQRTAVDQVRFRFPSAIGTVYQVFQSTTLEPRSWQALGPEFTATAPETIHDATVAPGQPRAFFRIAPVH